MPEFLYKGQSLSGLSGIELREISYADYLALSESEKNADVAYLISDAPEQLPVYAKIEEYDTDDGWHVRKWSDGYVEMSLKKTFENLSTSMVSDWAGSVAKPFFGPFTYPVPLVECYSLSASVSRCGYGGMVCDVSNGGIDLKLSTSVYAVWSPVARTFTTGSAEVGFHVTGRWK